MKMSQFKKYLKIVGKLLRDIKSTVNCLLSAANLVNIDANFAKKHPKVKGCLFMDHLVDVKFPL